MPNFIDLTKQEFYRLKVVSRAENDKNGRVRWNCTCSCGEKTIVQSYDLRSGNTRSCGCLHREVTAKINWKHGLTDTPEYNSWIDMKKRCYNLKNINYENYGGRGISVCDRWLHSFKNFLADMGKKPKGYTIERINNNKGYSLDNCKWATYVEQGHNKRNNHNITYKGITLCHTEWSRRLSKNKSTHIVGKRLRRGWSPERAVSTPPI